MEEENRLKKYLSENIVYMFFIYFIAQNYANKEFQDSWDKLKEKIKDVDERIDMKVSCSNLLIPRKVSTIAGFILSFILCKFLFKINKIFLLVVLVLIIGIIIGNLINKVSVKFVKLTKRKEMKVLDEEKKALEKDLEPYKEIRSRLFKIDADVREKLFENCKELGISTENYSNDYEGKIFYTNLYSYKLINNGECSTVQECLEKLENMENFPPREDEENMSTKDMEEIMSVANNKKFYDYIEMSLRKRKMGLNSDDREKILQGLPNFDNEYLREIESIVAIRDSLFEK